MRCSTSAVLHFNDEYIIRPIFSSFFSIGCRNIHNVMDRLLSRVRNRMNLSKIWTVREMCRRKLDPLLTEILVSLDYLITYSKASALFFRRCIFL